MSELHCSNCAQARVRLYLEAKSGLQVVCHRAGWKTASGQGRVFRRMQNVMPGGQLDGVAELCPEFESMGPVVIVGGGSG